MTLQELDLTLHASFEVLPPLLDSVDCALHAFGIDNESCTAILLSIDEVLSNIILHGQLDASSDMIQFQLSLSEGVISVDIYDPGPPFDIAKAADAAIPSDGPLSDITIGGWGLLLVRAFAADIHYKRQDDANHLKLFFSLPLAIDGAESST